MSIRKARLLFASCIAVAQTFILPATTYAAEPTDDTKSYKGAFCRENVIGSSTWRLASLSTEACGKGVTDKVALRCDAGQSLVCLAEERAALPQAPLSMTPVLSGSEPPFRAERQSLLHRLKIPI